MTLNTLVHIHAATHLHLCTTHAKAPGNRLCVLMTEIFISKTKWNWSSSVGLLSYSTAHTHTQTHQPPMMICVRRSPTSLLYERTRHFLCVCVLLLLFPRFEYNLLFLLHPRLFRSEPIERLANKWSAQSDGIRWSAQITRWMCHTHTTNSDENREFCSLCEPALSRALEKKNGSDVFNFVVHAQRQQQ